MPLKHVHSRNKGSYARAEGGLLSTASCTLCTTTLHLRARVPPDLTIFPTGLPPPYRPDGTYSRFLAPKSETAVESTTWPHENLGGITTQRSDGAGQPSLSRSTEIGGDTAAVV